MTNAMSSRVKKTGFTLGAALFALAVSGGEALTLEKATAFQAIGERIPVEPGASYELTLNAEGRSGRLDVAIQQFNSRKQRISPHQVNASAGTQTTLTAAAVKGAKSIVVADASAWDTAKNGRLIAFHVRDDFSDLPNSRLEYYIDKVTRRGAEWLVELNRGLVRNYPSGTAVRLHKDGSVLSWGVVLPLNKEFRRLVGAAPQYGQVPGKLWPGAAYVQLSLRTTSDEPVRIQEWSFKKISAADIARREQETAAAELAEKQKITPFGFGKILASGAGIEEFTNQYFLYRGIRHFDCGISQAALDMPAADAVQFECDFKAETSGILEMNVVQRSGDKTVSINLPAQTVIPDGQYRRFIFQPAKAPQWNPDGRLTRWILRFRHYKEVGFPIGFRNPAFLRESNGIAGSDKLLPGRPAVLAGLRPRGQYQLDWRGSQCPGVTVDFYDHLQQPIPGSRARLAPGAATTVFTAPEQMIAAKITLDGAGEGFPRLRESRVTKRYRPEIFWRGQWIWSRRGAGPDYAHVWFRKTLEMKEAPQYAAMAVMADDVADVFVNGTSVGKTWPFWKGFRFDIAKLLKVGSNRIDVRVFNADQAAGLCADLYIQDAQGGKWYNTDASWLCHESGKDKACPEKFTAQAIELGPPATTAPWFDRINFAYAGPRGNFHVLKTENGEFTARIENPPVASFETLTFSRRSASGKTRDFILPVERIDHADGTVTIRYPKLRPLTDEACRIDLKDDFWAVADDRPLAELAARPLEKTGLKKAEFTGVGTRPMIRFQGKSFNPTFYFSSEWDRLSPVLQAGFKSFLISISLRDVWRGENHYEFGNLESNIEYLLTVAPDAVFMLDIRMSMPDWWLRENPDDASAFFEKTPRNPGREFQSMGSKHWLTAAEAPIQALIERVKNSNYGDRIWGANIGDDCGNEWFWGGASAGSDRYGKPAQPGYSPADLQAFRAMLRKKYGTDAALAQAWGMPGLTIDRAEMPDHKLRRNGAVGSLFDPARDRRIMDWCYYRNQALAEAINHFAGVIKKLTDRQWLVGAYYGYWNELADNPGRSQLITGHNGFMECLNSPDMDFFRAPSRYHYRRPGLPNGIMQPWSTFTQHGKAIFIENDERTAYGPDEGSGFNIYTGRASTALESVGQCNREFGMAVTQGLAHYWMDHPKGCFYEPALLAVLGKQLQCYENLPPVQNLTPAEVAVIGDVDSIYYSIDGPGGIFPPATGGVFKRLNYLGISYRSLMMADLFGENAAPEHKFYIMLPTLVLSAERRAELIRRFDRERATVLWLYSAGSAYPERGPQAEFCGDFLKIKCKMEAGARTETLKSGEEIFEEGFSSGPHFYAESGYDGVIGVNKNGRPVVVSKKSAGGATHLFSTLTDLPVAFLDKLVGTAGVFRYTDRTADPLWIGNDLVFLHAATGGEKRIQLPEGLKMRAIIGPLSGEYESGQAWNAEAGLTYGFLVFKR